jgi:hypothetical protein
MRKLAFANAVLIAAIIYDYAVADRKNKVIFSDLKEDNELLREQLGITYFQMAYLATKLEKYGIELDEFDMIVLNNPTY